MRFADMVAIITGAGNGIGRATANILVSEGGRVAAVDILGESLDSLVDELTGFSGEAFPLVADALDPDQVQATVRSVLDRWGRVDILVNCVGGSAIIHNRKRPVEELEIEEWDRLLDFNLRATFLYCRAVLPHMKRQRSGKIINLSSRAATGLTQNSAAYSAAKAAIIGFTAKVAQEAGPYGINVNSIAPSMTLTPRVAELSWGTLSSEEQQAILGSVALGRLAQPEDQAKVIAFLASGDADYVSGQTINVNGGM